MSRRSGEEGELASSEAPFTANKVDVVATIEPAAEALADRSQAARPRKEAVTDEDIEVIAHIARTSAVSTKA